VFVLRSYLRFTDSVLRDILSYEKSGGRFTHEVGFDILSQRRKSTTVFKTSAPKKDRTFFDRVMLPKTTWL
jgi:hypothetical protein